MSVEIRSEGREPLAAPFVWFGGKSRAASLIWERLGNCQSYVEPFAGSLAVLLGRPHAPHVETVNDADGLLCNAWRAIAFDPDATAAYADWPVSECDLHARHAWLVNRRADFTECLMGDPDFFDAKAAGYWLWGINAWIGSGWCSGRGPWIVRDGRLVNSRLLGPGGEPETADLGSSGQGVNRQLPHLGSSGQGVNRQLPHLGSSGQGVNRKLPHLGDAGKAPSLAPGVNRQIPHVGNPGRGVNRPGEDLLPWFTALSERLRRVRVCCGDWSRVMGDSVLLPTGGACGIVLDPPYTLEERAGGLYAKDEGGVAQEVHRWAIANGDRKDLRIALCGYEGEVDMPASWTAVKWHARGGYDGQNKDRDNQNRQRETIWFSPACLKPESELPLFAAMNLNGESQV